MPPPPGGAGSDLPLPGRIECPVIDVGRSFRGAGGACDQPISIEEITPDNRAAMEGEVPPGVHRLPRFSVMLPNLGDAKPLTRRFQRIGADSRVHTAADMLFRFYVHTPGKPLSVIDGETEVENTVSRLRSLRSLSTPHV